MQNAPDRAAHIERIAALNDTLRANITKPTGLDRIVMTAGIAGGIGDVTTWSGWRKRAELLRTVRDFDAFSPDSPERDFGRFEWQEAVCYFKIDLYEEEFVKRCRLAVPCTFHFAASRHRVGYAQDAVPSGCWW